MKRLTSIFLVLAMLLTLAPMNIFAAETENTVFSDMKETDYYAQAATALEQLDILAGYPDGTFGAEKSITRAEMAAIVCRMIDKETDAEKAKGETIFDDVSSDHWASGYINIASEEGIINGDGNGKFRPEDDVKHEEAIKMVVCALGYGDDVEVDAKDWSKGYLEVADEKGISADLKGTKGKASTRADVAVMSYNGLATDAENAKIPATPVASKEAGEYKGTQKVKLTTTTKDADIYYTTDGTTPTVKSTKYTKEISISKTSTLKAIAVKNGVVSKGVMSADYTIKQVSSGGGGGGGSSRPSTPTYTVSFDLNYEGATGAPANQSIRSGNKATEPTAPEREGHVFLGWFTDEDCTDAFDFDDAIVSSITLYAQWHAIEIGSGSFRVTFDKNDGSGDIYQIQWVDAGEKANEPIAPTRELYGFTGWYMEAAAVTPYDFNIPVTSDLVLYAGWGNPNGENDDLYAASNKTETVFSISDIDVSNDEVTVTYNTNDVALINVEFFEDQMEIGMWNDENLNNNLSLTPITVASGYTESYGELATVTFPINATLPEHYLVRAKMFDSESNSTEYITAQYTRTFEAFDAQTMDDFDVERVINFDGEGIKNFGVLKESVIVVPLSCQYKGTQEFQVDDLDNVETIAEDDEPELEELVPDHLYTFPDKNAIISSDESGDAYRLCELEVGDVIYVEGTTWMFKIKSITENEDGSISFTQDKDVTMLDFYDTLKVDFEGIEAEVNDPRLRWEVIDVNGSGSVTVGPFSLAKEFSNGIELSGSISGKVTGEVKLFYDAHLFSADYFEASFSFDTEITGQVKAELSTGSNTDNNHEWKNVVFQVDTRKVKLPTPVTGLEIYIKPSAQIDWSLSGEVSITWTSKQTSGFKYNSDTGRTDIKKKTNTVSVMAKGKAEAKIGPIIDIGVDVLGGVLSGGVVAEAGAKLTAEAEIGADDLINNADSKHACGLCVSGRADWYASAYVKCSYKITNSLKGDIVKVEILNFTSPIKFNGIPGKFFFSVINSTDSSFGGYPKFGGGDCTNKTHRTEFRVQDQNGQDIEGINVSVVKQGQNSGKSGVSPYVTYLYDGTYKASATIDNTTVSKTFTVNSNRQTVVLNANSVDTVLEGVVIDANNRNTVIPGVSVKVSRGSVVIASTETDSNGKFSIAVPSGSLTVEFSKENYLSFVSTETIHEGDANHSMGQVELTPGSGMGGFHGMIRDAVTNEPISDVTLNLYIGWNNPAESNTAIRTLKTNSNGEFRYETTSLFGNIIGLAAGNYTLTASKEGYSDTSYNIVIYPGTTDENPAINETMSPGMNDGFYRIVLTWGMSPRDLDSHLVADTSDDGNIHVYYSQKNPYPNYANLDVDDTDSEGPETITITNFEGLSNIRYAVHDYTNRDNTSSDWLSNSGAVVRLYKGSQLLRTFNVPSGYSGTEWDVFSLDSNGRITSINTMTNNSNPSNVLGNSRARSVAPPLKDYELEDAFAETSVSENSELNTEN